MANHKQFAYKLWVVKSPRCDGFPLSNIFYRRQEARKFAEELRQQVGGVWNVLAAALKVGE